MHSFAPRFREWLRKGPGAQPDPRIGTPQIRTEGPRRILFVGRDSQSVALPLDAFRLLSRSAGATRPRSAADHFAPSLRWLQVATACGSIEFQIIPSTGKRNPDATFQSSFALSVRTTASNPIVRIMASDHVLANSVGENEGRVTKQGPQIAPLPCDSAPKQLAAKSGWRTERSRRPCKWNDPQICGCWCCRF